MDLDWNEIVEDLGPRLYRYFHARFSPQEASDLTQETLIRLVRKTRDGGYQPDKGNVRMYAFGIAHYVALDAGRGPFIDLSTEAEDSIAPLSTEEIMIERQEAEVARRTLGKLPVVQREILLLMIDEEMTLADISLLLGIPVGTVKSHIFRAKARLRELLDQERKVR